MEYLIRTATDGDAGAVETLLQSCKLPGAGFSAWLHEFLLAEAEGRLAGVAGLEIHGQVALLRSVAVNPADRSTGLAQELVRRLLDAAYERGLQQVCLLTETAANFFPRFGFREVPRAEAPPELQASVEFQGACPASAKLFVLSLRRPPTLVRLATEADVPAITRIYNQGIEDRTATLETQLRSEEERREWLAGHTDRYPVIVAVRRGEVVGWASLNRFSPREAYRWVADFSIYVAREERGTGLGTLLLTELERRARALEFHKLILTTFTFSSGVTLYEKMGYRRVGVYQEQGMLDGRWVDTLLMEKLLRD